MWLWMMKYPDTKLLGTLLAEELQILCFANSSSSSINIIHNILVSTAKFYCGFFSQISLDAIFIEQIQKKMHMHECTVCSI